MAIEFTYLNKDSVEFSLAISVENGVCRCLGYWWSLKAEFLLQKLEGEYHDKNITFLVFL